MNFRIASLALVTAGLFATSANAATLMGAYQFEETSGTTAANTAGDTGGGIFAPDGTYGGAVTLGQTGAGGSTYSAYFDATAGGQVQIVQDGGAGSDSILAVTGDWSISFWVKPDSNVNLGAERFLVSKGTAPDNNHFFQMNMNNKPGLGNDIQAVQGFTSMFNTAAQAIAFDAWSHVTYVNLAALDQSKIYINGVLAGTVGSVNDMPANADRDWFIARRPDQNGGFKGNIDEVGIFSGGLSDSEVADIYANGLPIPVIPEPATLGLMAIGTLAILRRRH